MTSPTAAVIEVAKLWEVLHNECLAVLAEHVPLPCQHDLGLSRL